ncbi:5-carboxymethyl-2-hydroxymuconate Delta-isomerase [Moraxella oblonga]|uniref:5-carboxymethyl-2-hydroxymuconate Delta-isomerase n=1 Tax=Moraxella oblonga TaxID=200413 RepID=UPI0008334FB7|nr:hypothetical protein [Moraxella oblonga]
MPHVTLEFSQNLQIANEGDLLLQLNTTLFESGQFKHSKDIKTRLYHANGSLIGLGAGDGEHFVVAHLAIMAGRTDDIKADLVERVMNVLQKTIGKTHQNVQYTVNLTELSPHYQKAII